MKKIVLFLVAGVCAGSVSPAFAELTDAQRAEQQRQQRAAQSAYQASADSYDQVAREAAQAKKVAADVRDASVYTYVGAATGGYGGAAAGAAVKAYDVAVDED